MYLVVGPYINTPNITSAADFIQPQSGTRRCLKKAPLLRSWQFARQFWGDFAVQFWKKPAEFE